MTALRYTAILFFSLLTLSIQTAHAADDFQPKAGWMSMDLSHALTSPTSARLTNMIQQLAIQERAIAKSMLKAKHNIKYSTALLLDHNNQSVHNRSMDPGSQQQAWLIINHDRELISNIPTSTTDALLNQSQKLLTILDTKQANMSQAVQDAAFDAKDTLLSIIMPGGLLYASYRKHSLTQAKEQLAQVTNERDELAKDLLMIQSISRPVALASVD